MWKQIRLLSGIDICNIFGLNEARYGHEAKRKRRIIFLCCTFVFLCAMLMLYVGAFSFAYISLGMSGVVPIALFSATSLIIIFFTLFKAGHVIFNVKTYERTAALPVKASAIVISRFLTMYIFNAALSLLVFIPGFAVYAFFIRPGVSFYIMALLGAFLMPLLAITIGSALGALILAIASRLKHKKLISLLLSVILVVGILIASTAVSFSNGAVIEGKFAQLSSIITDQLGRAYPPALLFSGCILNGDWLSFGIFAAVSIAVFLLFVFLIQLNFSKICAGLGSVSSKRNYVLHELPQSSRLKALYIKDLKRYFASSIYVLNTGVGYILILVFSIAVLVFGADKISAMTNTNGLLEIISPFILAMMCIISPTTTSAVSIEGKQWWIMKSIPVKAKTIFDSKILVNLTLALPFSLISSALLCFAFRPSPLDCLWMFLIPVVYIFFGAVVGIAVNRKMPVFNWESETTIVKQSGAVLVCMITNFISVGLPAALLLLLPADFRNYILTAASAAVIIAAFMVYVGNSKVILNKI